MKTLLAVATIGAVAPAVYRPSYTMTVAVT